ncbi:MAG: MFS transporter [Pseudomonadales bacterium]|nr:MFS transporter [Pseudomonadales bacterium]
MRAVASLASLYLVRMLGLFMLLPVLAIYARDLDGTTPFLIGIALGIYGLTQACLQLPLGMLSDRIGRKPVILGGLLVFLAGSLLAASSDTIHGIIAGRALQGAGAIASTLMALLADVTREQNRSKAMASIGVSIGLSFALSLVLGPVIAAWDGLEGLFLIAALLAVLGMLITVFVVPTPLVHRHLSSSGPGLAALRRVLSDRQLLRLDGGAFVLQFIMTAIFVAVPFMLVDDLHIARQSHGPVYGMLLGVSFIAMVPFMVIAERKRLVKPFFVGAVALIVLALAQMPLARHNLYGAMVSLWLFFLAFNFLEAMLPSLLSRAVQRDNRGTATGVYSSFQFLGAFCGGASGGLAMQHFGLQGVFWLCASLGVLWLSWAIGMRGPQYLRSITLTVDAAPAAIAALSDELHRLPGVREVLIIAGESVAYLQVDSHFDDEHLSGLPVSVV